ncbi:hypothetical protein jhhlp_003422 [Lomentospora prolificans]|uniref:Protein BCP1 n=1 Tax=Lomentospora prolificans TaxID=41688 RepID=A0A2N3N8P1_9PEZI|nr:hypothetical protein jhhlp_003422 [Lomentospora prolificans]
MGKKRDRDSVSKEDAKRDPNAMDQDSSDDEDFDIVNVDFEWFNFDPTIDFHGTKSLLRQLLDVDSSLFDTSSLADLILSTNTLGSTVKVDGKETDPYALITALRLRQRQQHPGLDALATYLASKATAVGPSLAPLATLLADKDAHAGLVLAERLINMPAEVAGPLYTMLVDELDDAVEENEPYDFTHYILLSRVYREVLPDPEVAQAEAAAVTSERRSKKQKGGRATAEERDGAVFYFHPEDEVFARFAAASGSYAYTKEDEANADSKRAFQEMGVKTEGLVMLFDRDGFREGVKAVAEFLKGASS